MDKELKEPETSKDEETRMPFWSHLEELRKRIIYSLIAVAIGFSICFSYSEEILGLLMIPMNMTMGVQSHFPFFFFTPNKVQQDLHFLTLTEPFMSHLKIGFAAGLVLALPFILLQIWKFISPGLLPNERKYAGHFVFFSSIFFAIGVLFCYFLLLPFAIPFLVGYKTEHLKPMITIGQYLSFIIKFLLGSGAVFELPLVLVLLGRMGILNPQVLTKFRKYAFLISFIIGAIVTPTPDAFNMTLMSIPIYLLYELGILGVRIFGRKRKSDSSNLMET